MVDAGLSVLSIAPRERSLEGIYRDVSAPLPTRPPVCSMETEAWRVQIALTLGGGLGLALMVLAIAHLARREVL